MSTAPTGERLYTPDDLLAMEDGNAYELVDGRLVELDLGFDSQEVALNIGAEIKSFLKGSRLGSVASEVGLQIFRNPRKLRRPDIAFFSNERLQRTTTRSGNMSVPPDLAVEVVSKNDIAADLEQKVNEYLEAGVRLVWVAYPQTRTISVRRPDGSGLALTPNAKLEGEEVLPGFSVLVADLFPEPGPEPAEDVEP